jgi:L-histidine Nalpha-methyltransferase
VRYQRDTHIDEHTLRKLIADDVFDGLTHTPKSLPPKYFYDHVGSALFERITRLPEYYLTRAEHRLLRSMTAPLIHDLAPEDLVEIGSGASIKTHYFLDALGGAGRRIRYIPVDVDAQMVDGAAERLMRAYPFLDVHAVIGDFERHLNHVPPASGRRLVAFLGSTIGNLEPGARHELLLQLGRLLRREDRLLLGVDLVKDPAILEAAYNDRQGVTAEFNRNILRVVNRELGADFDPHAFSHRAFYDPATHRIEMHLFSHSPQTVWISALELTVHIATSESIWTESSYKFTHDSSVDMLRSAGLHVERWLTDPDRQFALVLAGRGGVRDGRA